MGNLKEIKNRIKSVESIHQITKAMKMVASSRIHKVESLLRARGPYTAQLKKIMGSISGQMGDFTHPLMNDDGNYSKVAILAVTGEKGLCGAYNNSIIRNVERLRRKFENDGCDVLNYVIGSKIVKHFDRRGYECAFKMSSWNPDDDFADELFTRLSSDFVKGVFDVLYIVSGTAKSRSAYTISEQQYLPFVAEVSESGDESFVFEPSLEKSVELIVPMLLKQILVTTLLSARYAEYAARIVAMTNATDNAEKLAEELRLNYFRARQAAITTEILEVSAAAAQIKK